MIFFLYSLLSISYSKGEDLPETKHLEGNVFGWPNALALQKNIWANIPIPYIRFYKSEINLAKLTKEIISGRLNFNLSSIIEDMLNSIQEDFNSDSDNKTTTDITTENLKYHLNTLFENNNNQIFNLQDSSPQNNQCNEDKYPNAYLITRLMGEEIFKDIDCEIPDELIGQFLSYILIIAPILVIFIFSFLFYILFFFLRFCCCRAKNRFNPGCFCIIFFIIVSASMLISVGFSFVSSFYMYKIFDYIFSEKILNEAETACKLLNPSLNNGLQKVVNELLPAISNISNQTITTIDQSLPQLMAVFDTTVENLTQVSNTMSDVSQFGVNQSKSCAESESKFNACLASNDQHLNDQCKENKPVNISLIESFTDFSSAFEISKELDGYLSNITDIMNVTSFIDSGKTSLTDAISNIEESVKGIKNVSLIDKCEFHEYFDFINEIPSFIVTIAKASIFILPIIMLLMTIIEILVFWTKNCCSRCCAGCCIPCCICTFCQMILGLICTFFGLFILLMNVFYNQGDDVFDVVMREVTNDDKTIYFGSLDLSSVSSGVIGSFPLDSIRLNQIHFIKNFIDAKIDSTLSDILSMNEMPFNDIANMIEKAFISASETTNLDTMIVGPIEKIINETQSTLPESNLSNIADISQMNQMLDVYNKSVEHCYPQCSVQFSELSENYNEFFNGFSRIDSTFSEIKGQIGPILNEVPIKVSIFANDLFGGLLKTMGNTVGDTLRLIIPIFDKIELKWLIGAFNIVRVRFCYNLLAAFMCISISSHLFIVGMTAMSLTVWIRRRGMGKENEKSEDEDDSSSKSSKSSKSSDSSSDSSESSVQTNCCCRRKKVHNVNNDNGKKLRKVKK